MASIVVTTTPEEQDKVLAALKQLGECDVAVSTIASMTGINATRARYVLLDLVESGRVVRIPSKLFNRHYVRYHYKITTRKNK